MRRPGDCGIDEAETFRKYETMHLKIIVAILCLSLVLVQAGGMFTNQKKHEVIFIVAAFCNVLLLLL